MAQITGMRRKLPLNSIDGLLRDVARRTIKSRMDCLGLSRTELAAMLGITMSYLDRIIAGHVWKSGQVRMNIEVALGIPIWSKPEDFAALTRVLMLQAMSSTTPEQVAVGIRSPKKPTQ